MKKSIPFFLFILTLAGNSFAATSFNLDMPHPRLPEISLPDEVPAPDPPQVRTFCAQELPCASTANNTHSGSETFTGNLIATTGQNIIKVYNLDGIPYVDGNKYPTLASAIAPCPAAGVIIIDTLVEAFTLNPFAGCANPVQVQFGPGIWTTTVPLVHAANQWTTGAGPQQSVIRAIAGFPAGRAVVELGAGAETHSSFVRDIGLSCAIGVVGCSGVVFDGAQNPAGTVNVNVTNYTQDGVRIQQTSAASSGISLRDMTVYSPPGMAATGSGVNVANFSGDIIVENVTQSNDHSFPGAQAFLVAGGTGQITFIGSTGEGVTDIYKLTGASASTVIVGVSQNASSTPSVNTVHVGAGVINYNLMNVNQGNSTGAALVDDNRSYTCTGNITYLSVTGSATKYDYGSCPTIGWVRTPATTVTAADLIRLQAGFVASNRNYDVLDNSANTQFGVTNDGRILFRGNQAGAFTQGFANNTLGANRTTTFSDISGLAVTEASAAAINTIPKALDATHANLTASSLTDDGTTVSTSEALTVTGAINCTIINAIRCVSPSNPQGWAGADIGAWLNAAYANLPAAGGRIQIASNSNCYTFTTPIVFGTNLKPVSVEGDGYSTCLNYTAASGIAILIDWGTGERVGHGLEKLWLEGPGGSVGSGTGIGIQVGSTNGADFVTLTSVKVTGFQTGLFSNNGNSFLLRVDKSQFGGNIQNVLMSGGLENNTFTDSLFNNYTNANQVNSVQITSAGDYHFKDCSFDDAQLSVGSAANVSVLGGHFENPTLGTNYAFWNFTGSNSLAFVAVNFLQDKVAAAPAQVGTINGNGTLSYFQTSYFSGAIQTNNITISGGNPNITVIGAQDGSINYSGPYIGGVTTGQIVTLPEPKIKTYAFGTSGGFDSTQKQFFIGGVPGASNILQFSYNPAATVGGVVGNLASLTQSNVANECVWDTSANMGCAGFLGATNGFRPSAAGAADLGTTLLPFGNLWLGTAATNNFKFQPAATAAARVVSILDPGAASTLDLTSNTTTTTTQVLHGSATAGLGTWSAVATADIATALTTPGPIGGTTPGTGKFTTITETNLLISNTAPTIAGAGCGGSAATIASNNGTADFTINTGTAPTSGGCTVTMPAATTAWDCSVNDITTTSATVFLQKKTGGSTTSVILQNFSTTPAAAAPVANDIWEVRCTAR